MTGNQISYARFLEDQRHNLATEAYQQRQIAEIERHNVVQESQGWKSLLENERHNREGEKIGWGQLNLGWSQLSETKRHNMAGEAYNRAYLAETQRHNLRGEEIQWFTANANYELGKGNLAVAQQRAQTEYLNYEEKRRANKSVEAIAYWKTPGALAFNPEWAWDLASTYVSGLDSIGDWITSNPYIGELKQGEQWRNWLELIPGYTMPA